MKYIKMVFLLLLFNCDGNNQVTKQNDTSNKNDCDINVLMSTTCKICHTPNKINDYFPTYSSLTKFDSIKLKLKMDSLKVYSRNHLFIDTLTSHQINCIVKYIINHDEFGSKRKKWK